MYRIAVDIGGTFTDLVAAAGDGAIFEAKVPSRKDHPELALEAGLAELATATGAGDVAQLLALTDIVIQGTTVAINAVLQRSGVKTGLLSTDGFRDTLEIRLGYKDERYRFDHQAAAPLVPRSLRLTARERIDKEGRVHTPLAESDVLAAAEGFAAAGVEAVAVSFLWSFLDARHEQRAAELLRERLPGVFVTTSAEVLPRIREYNRTSTTVLNAYVGPIVERHVARTDAALRRLGFTGRVRYVQSNGGLAESAEVRRRPVLLLVSGPAAGPAAGLQFAPLAGRDFITIDMGGTSFDTCLVRDGLPDMRSISDLDGYRVGTPLIDVHAIGSGGGSLAWLDEGLLRVGPRSAEAVPGPACYQRGGIHATVTDANVATGLLNPRELLGGRFPIDATLAAAAIERDVSAHTSLSIEEAAVGLLEVVNRDMADAVREITVRRGHDPREFSLVVGGGAGGLHAAQLAAELRVSTIVVPRVASALCAFGAVVADVRHDAVHSHVVSTAALDTAVLAGHLDRLESNARDALREEGVPPEHVRVLRSLDVRYRDQVWEVTIDVSDLGLDADAAEVRLQIEDRFHARHQQLFDFSQPGRPCELVSMTLTVIGLTPPLPVRAVEEAGPSAPVPSAERPVRFARSLPTVMTPVYAGAGLAPGAAFAGPAIVEEPNTTVVVPPGWDCRLDGAHQAYVLQATS
jgi:N-methylhydantoinase A